MRKSSGKKATRLHRLRLKAKAHREAVQTTLGELIAAAFDTVGNEVKDVTRLLSSREISRAAHARIVLVQ
ncbi:MAG TPA: chaperonin [Myxococcaceae bacterium]|nr:chaperonin [Myxococcaceae bacterium]